MTQDERAGAGPDDTDMTAEQFDLLLAQGSPVVIVNHYSAQFTGTKSTLGFTDSTTAPLVVAHVGVIRFSRAAATGQPRVNL